MLAKRKDFRISGEHAFVNSFGKDFSKEERIAFKRRRIVKRVSKRELPKAYSIALCIANLLYPKNFPKIIASGIDKKTTYSKRIHLSDGSQKGINAFYKDREIARTVGGRYKNPWRGIAFLRHEKNVAEKITKIAGKIESESGIRVNYLAVNVGEKGKEIVFFEVFSIDSLRLKQKIGSLRESLKKKQLLELFEELEKHCARPTLVLTHYQF